MRVQSSVGKTRLKYYEQYPSAEQVKVNFFSDLASAAGRSLAADLFLLGLPRFEDVNEEFRELCRLNGV